MSPFSLVLVASAIGLTILAMTALRSFLRARRRRKREHEKALLAHSAWTDAIDSRLDRGPSAR
jgi:hypothetical protein